MRRLAMQILPSSKTIASTWCWLPSGEKRERGDVQSDPESDRYVPCPDRTVLGCRLCRESLILLGREQDWYSEGRTIFECYQCGGAISFADDLDGRRRPDPIGDSAIRGFDEVTISVRDLIRSLKASGQ
jgi:hypothetical protein